MGVEKNEAEAVKWFRQAADQGLAMAQYSLGCCYGNGEGVEKDEAESVKWYRKAAEQGNADAQYNLGCCYDNGHGVEKDQVEAYAFYNLAAISIQNAKDRREYLEKKMSPSQVAEGQRRTKELKAEVVKSKGE